MTNTSPTFIHTPFVNPTMKLIQERIDIKQQDLEWMENTPPENSWIADDRKIKIDYIASELDFLGKLVESMRKGGI